MNPNPPISYWRQGVRDAVTAYTVVLGKSGETDAEIAEAAQFLSAEAERLRLEMLHGETTMHLLGKVQDLTIGQQVSTEVERRLRAALHTEEQAVPLLRDPEEIQRTIARTVAKLVAGTIGHREARTILYALQCAALNYRNLSPPPPAKAVGRPPKELTHGPSHLPELPANPRPKAGHGRSRQATNRGQRKPASRPRR